MGSGPLGATSLPALLLEEESAGGVGVELGVVEGAGVELVAVLDGEPLGGGVL